MKRKDFLKSIGIGLAAAPFISFKDAAPEKATKTDKTERVSNNYKARAIKTYSIESSIEGQHHLRWYDDDRSKVGILKSMVIDCNKNAWFVSGYAALEEYIEIILIAMDSRNITIPNGTLVIYQNAYPENAAI